ncbi:MAG: cytochrome P450 [Acidobacteria bacterium]|nr:cytochrome P450 [Acidobacteriota bacterium]MCA1639088.1 cytochrome P450 [Acidobacteriota bacterium]
MKASAQQNLPPSVKPNWIGGHFGKFRRNPTGFLTELSKLGDVAYFKMGGQHAYFLNHPDLVRDLLIVNAHKFVKGRALQRAKSLLGEGLLTSEGEAHLRQRRMIQPAFHREKIKSYAEAMTEFAAKMANEWKDGETRDIDKEMMRLTLQIVGKTLFSANVKDEADEVGAALTTMIEMFNYLLLPFSEILEKLPIPQARRFNHAKETLDSVIYGIINERRKSGEDKGDLLSMLLTAQDEEGDRRGMSDKQVRDECLTLLLAGHETTANALTWTFYLLSQNPEKEVKLHEELDRVLPDGKIPSIEDLPNLKYAESVLAESMRLFPPAWALGRLAVEEHEFNNYKIPKGALVLVSMYVLHRDERFWEDAEIFKPERWLYENAVKEANQKFVYFPFGGGIRRCIGESFAWTEGILLLAALTGKWKLRLLPEQRIELNALMTLRPRFGMKMKIEKR